MLFKKDRMRFYPLRLLLLVHYTKIDVHFYLYSLKNQEIIYHLIPNLPLFLTIIIYQYFFLNH